MAVTETEVMTWFRSATPRTWELPSESDTKNIAALLNKYFQLSDDPECVAVDNSREWSAPLGVDRIRLRF